MSEAEKWPDWRCFQPGSREWQLQCERWHCRGGALAASLGFHGVGGSSTSPRRRCAGSGWYTNRSWPFFLSPRGMVATWPDLEKKHATICFATLFDHLSFTGGASPGKTYRADCCFVSGSYWKIHISLPAVTMPHTRLDLWSKCQCADFIKRPLVKVSVTKHCEVNLDVVDVENV